LCRSQICETNNAPGQSGDPNSKHYDDLFRKWANGKTVPLLYSRKKVEKATEKRIILLLKEDHSTNLRFDHVDRQLRLIDADLEGIDHRINEHDREIRRLKFS
jgi:penicillin amidase